MRIVFLVNRDIESNFALNLLMPEIHRSAVGIFLSEQVGASRTVSARMLGAVQTLATLKDPSALQKLREMRADLFVSIRFGKIFRPRGTGTFFHGRPPGGASPLGGRRLPWFVGRQDTEHQRRD